MPIFRPVLDGNFGTGKQESPKYCLWKSMSLLHLGTLNLQVAICIYHFVDIRTEAVAKHLM